MRSKLAWIFLIVLIFSGCSATKNPGSSSSGSNVVVEYNPENSSYFSMYALLENTLNPLLLSDDSGKLVMSLLYRPLVVVNQDFDFTTDLAESISPTNGCMSYNITLKKDITWSDGSEFTSADVKYTFDKIFEYSKDSQYHQNLYNVKNYSVSGKYGFNISLTYADASFPCMLNFPIIKNGSAKDDFVPVGTGDYIFDDYKKYSSFTLKLKSPQEDNPFNIIKVSLLNDINAVYSSYKLGSLDVAKVAAHENSGYSKEQGDSFVQTNTNKYTFLSVNLGSPVLSQPSVRRLLEKIVSSDSVVKDLAPEFAVDADSFVNPNAYFAIKNEISYGDIKQAFDSLGYISDDRGIRTKQSGEKEYVLSFDMIVNSDNPQKVIISEYLANLFSSYGINCIVKKLSFDEYNEALATQAFDLALCETKISLNNNYSYLIGSGGHANFGQYSSARADSLMQNILCTENKEERKKLLTDLQKLFYEDMPHIPLWFSYEKILYNSDKLDNFKIGGLDDEYKFPEISVE